MLVWCPVVTLVTFSSNISNFEINSKKPKKSKKKTKKKSKNFKKSKKSPERDGGAEEGNTKNSKIKTISPFSDCRQKEGFSGGRVPGDKLQPLARPRDLGTRVSQKSLKIWARGQGRKTL